MKSFVVMGKSLLEYIAAAGFVLLPVTVAAQNLNPTVEVSRQYRGSMADVIKPSVDMALPDSVLRFNLEYDYSVFDSPFRGSYEFRPFLTDMDIAPGVSPEHAFYLRAGAGYSLHPELDLVWSPVRNDRFRLSLYAMHDSYVGRYRTLGLSDSGSEPAFMPDGSRYSGYDLESAAGVDGSLDWNTGVMSFRAGYYGTALKDTSVTRAYDGVDLKFGLSSKQRLETHFVYDLNAAYRYAEDKFSCSAAARNCMTEHNLDIDASVGGSFRSGHSVLVDFGMDYARYGGVYDSWAGDFFVTPHYVYSGERWNVDLGVRLAFLFGGNGQDSPALLNVSGGQVVYPDIRVDFTVIRKYMDLYLAAGGGPDINEYSSLLYANHRITPFYNSVSGAPLLDNTVERISAVAGLKGNIASRLRYDLSAGYRNFGNAPFASVAASGDSYHAALGYSAFQMFFARLDFSWISQDFTLGGWVKYQTTDLARRNAYLMAPSDFSGYVKALYNWKERIYFGVDCGFATSRRGVISSDVPQMEKSVRIPGYADLGAYFEYAFTRKFSLWLRGGNLLDAAIQRIPLYTESGIYFTAGICLNL